MTEGRRARSGAWTARITYLVLAFVLLVAPLLPINTVPRGYASPDILLAVTAAWAARRPDTLPAPVVAGVFLLADFLFTTDDLSVPAIQRRAAELGIDPAAFDSCRAAPETKARLEAEMKAVADAGLEGLPTTYVGGKRLVGAQSDDSFKAALERAARAEDETGVPGWAYLLVVLASILTVLRLGYRPDRA